FKLAYIRYQSREDWREERDLVRCNPEFFNEPRYDSILIEGATKDLCFGRLRALVHCIMPSGRPVGLAMVNMFTHSHWKPKTRWDGARVYKEGKDVRFVHMDLITRGALLAPAFGQTQADLHYLVDALDSDMFLR
ncbi:hypothetical protein HDZ31DRAFT_6413, partial [Schizophyllum fasciatum]